MISAKRVLRIAVPVVTLALGATLYAGSRSTDCAHLSMFAKVMQATHLAKVTPCQVDQFGQDVYICHDEGHHCNVGNGPGKCTTVVDPIITTNTTCQCLGK